MHVAMRVGTFRVLARIAVAASVLAVAPALAAGVVQVTFQDPDKFTDVGDNARVVPDERRDAILDELRRHIERAASRLPDGGRLAVTVTDVDMAGNFETPRGPRVDHMRIYREVYPPRIKLEFRLTDAAGKVLKEGKRNLSDAAYLATNIEYRGDLLRHEKKLLDDWLRREFPIPA